MKFTAREKQAADYLIMTHAAFTLDGSTVLEGVPQRLAQVLSRESATVLMEFPLDSREIARARCSLLLPDGTREIQTTELWPSLLRRIHEVVFAAVEIWRLTPKVVIAVDPLNGAVAAASLLRRCELIYVSVDFAHIRFRSRAINSVYHWLDRFAAVRAKQCWAVSRRILAVRARQRRGDEGLALLPNAPLRGELSRHAPMPETSLRLLLLANRSPLIDFDTVLGGLALLDELPFRVTLCVVGDGYNEQEVRASVASGVSVELLGSMGRAAALEVARACHIGLAPYAQDTAFRYFSDPGKIRDYFSAGLPVIAAGDFELAETITRQRLGVMIELNPASFARAVSSIAADLQTYSRFAARVQRFAQQNTFERFAKECLANLESKPDSIK